MWYPNRELAELELGATPCLFAKERAVENAAFIREVLPAGFTERYEPGRTTHPLLIAWHNPGPTSFLDVNLFAEDARLVASKPGWAGILRDLLDAHSYEPARHTLHVAAMFERAQAGSVVELIDARNNTSVDFILGLPGSTVAVESKLLMRSGFEERFHRVANKLIERLLVRLDAVREPVAVIVVMKDKPELCDLAGVETALNRLLGRQAAHLSVSQSPGFNLRVEWLEDTGAFERQRLVHVFARVPEGETLRVRDRAREASRQLREASTGERGGLLSLGLNDKQASSIVFEVLLREMQRGRYRGIGAILLSRVGLHVKAPLATVVDLADMRWNPAASTPVTNDVRLRSVGQYLPIAYAEPRDAGLAVYQQLHASAIPTGRGPGAFGIRDIRRLPRDMVS